MEIEESKPGTSNSKMIELLVGAGFKPESAEKYSKLFQEHEIDASILTSPLLNHDILKDIGISTLGHRLRILAIGVSRAKAKEGEDYNAKPTDKLSIDEALGEKPSKKSSPTLSSSEAPAQIQYDSDQEEDPMEAEKEKITAAEILNWDSIVNRAKYIPVRLNEKERKQLHLIEAALTVSDYTGKVDIISYEKKSKRSFEQLKEICAVLCGLLVASDYNQGQKLIANRNFKDNKEFFQQVFEVGRRHKIMNPEKMRSEYGKLIYLLQDSALPEIEDLMGFSCKIPVKTVYGLLEERGALDVLRDPDVSIATLCIIDDKNRNRNEIQKEIKRKEKAVEAIASKYESGKISKAEIRLCLRSIGDNHAFLLGARDPLDQMIKMLKDNFSPNSIEGNWSLAISYGKGGARLNHDHERQYNYVLQSLTFWRNVAHDMFKLWILSEEDLLDADNRYKLSNTGQGLNRVQNCPRVAQAMSRLLGQTKQQINEWVGSSVVHLGDHNVPNALLFIDKYTQIPRIINPVLKTVEQVDEMYKNAGLKAYIDSFFGGRDKVKKDILTDFFRHAFDGSGADNFFDAGSCIDGRLTSAWNWCEKLPKKEFYTIFKLSGFVGFDGDFQR